MPWSRFSLAIKPIKYNQIIIYLLLYYIIMTPLTPEQEAVIKQIQDNLETALKNLHNAIRSSWLAATQAYLNAMCRLDEYAFWMSQCQIQMPGMDQPMEEVEPAIESEPVEAGNTAQE